MKIWCWAFGLSLAAAGAAEATSIRFSPAPPVAGRPIIVTFESVALSCGGEGLLQAQNIAGQRVDLRVTPPNCPFVPIGFLEYTASTTIGPLAAGTYTVVVTQGGCSSTPRA